MRLEDVELILHVPVHISEPLLGCVVIGVLALFISEGRDHTIVELFDLGGRVFAILSRGWTLGAYLAYPHVLQFLLGRCTWLLLLLRRLLLRAGLVGAVLR